MTAARRSALFLSCWALLLSGCSFGPLAVRHTALRYNDAVVTTSSEQFLLNIVRLRYRDEPMALAISAINASFDLNATGPLSFPVGRAGSIGDILGPQAHVDEAPTITYTPQGGPDYTQGFLLSISVDRVIMLVKTGWDLERVLRLTVQGMNGLDNVPNPSGQGSERVPRFVEFAFASKVLGELNLEGKLELAQDPVPIVTAVLSEPELLPLQKVTVEVKEASEKQGKKSKSITKEEKTERAGVKATDLQKAAESNMEFHHIDADHIILQKTETPYVLRIAPDAWARPEVAQAAALLKLIPGAPNYHIVSGTQGRFRRKLDGPSDEIIMTTRSVLSAILYMSKGVEIPEEHYRQGLVSVPVDAEGRAFDWKQVTDGLFRIRVSKHKPKCAFVSVKYRGYWFYIADNDLSSKSTFGLMIELHNLEITRGTSGTPQLTLPVGGGGHGKGH
jgi:hypothetical protein